MYTRLLTLSTLCLQLAGCESVETSAATAKPAAQNPSAQNPSAQNPSAQKPAGTEPSGNKAPALEGPESPAHKTVEIPRDPPKPSREQLEALRKRGKTFQAKVDAGRKASRAGAYDIAFAAFAEARKLRPHDPRVLGESGFASLKAGKMIEARRWTREAITRTTHPDRLGALHYNMGMIEEAEGNTWSAAQHYRQSLALRANVTVSKRLRKLGEVPAPAGIAEIDAYCMSLAEQLDCYIVAEAGNKPGQAEQADEEAWCGCRVEAHIKSSGPKVLSEAAILVVGLEEEGVEVDTIAMLAVKTETGGWQEVHTLPNSWVKELVDNDVDRADMRSLRFENVVSGPPPELLVNFSHVFDDLPDTLDAKQRGRRVQREEGMVLCSVRASACVSWLTKRETQQGPFAGWEWTQTTTTLTEIETSFENSKALVHRAKRGSTMEEPWSYLIGPHPYRGLFVDPHFSPVLLH